MQKMATNKKGSIPEAIESSSDLFIDVMVGSHFELQLKFPVSDYPTIRIDERNVAVIPLEDLEAFARMQIAIKRPTLMNKDFHCEFSNQKV